VVGQKELVPQGDLIDVDDLTHILRDALDENLLVHTCPLAAIREVVAAPARSSALVWAASPAPYLHDGGIGDIVRDRRRTLRASCLPDLVRTHALSMP